MIIFKILGGIASLVVWFVIGTLIFPPVGGLIAAGVVICIWGASWNADDEAKKKAAKTAQADARHQELLAALEASRDQR
jgi:hypothetical protein